MKLNRYPLEQFWKTLLVAYNTGREVLRDRIFWVLSAFTLAAIIGSSFTASLAEPAALGNGRLLIDLNLAAIRFLGALAAVLVGAGLISREVSGRTIWIVLAQPVSRTGFLLGKYLGLLAPLGLFLLVMSGSLALVLLAAGAPCPSGLFLSALLIYSELWLLGAIALFFSTFAPAFLGVILTLCLFALGHATPVLKLLASQSESLPARWGSIAIYRLFPNFQNFDPALPGLASLPGVTIGAGQVALILVYGLGVTAIFLFLAALIFNARREFR